MRGSEIECMQIAEIISAGRGEYKYMTVLHWWYIAALFLSFLDQKLNDEAECNVDDENDDSGRCTEREPIANGTFERVEQDSISCHIIIMMMMLLIIMMKTFNHIMMNRHHDDDGKDHKDTKVPTCFMNFPSPQAVYKMLATIFIEHLNVFWCGN